MEAALGGHHDRAPLARGVLLGLCLVARYRQGLIALLFVSDFLWLFLPDSPRLRFIFQFLVLATLPTQEAVFYAGQTVFQPAPLISATCR